jgi:hypothetical protein
MKIKKSELTQIIQEEAVKVKKILTLEAEKKEIKKQLNEMYGGEMEEGWFTGTKKATRDQALSSIMKHPHKKSFYQKLLSAEPEKAEKYIGFYMKDLNGITPTWNEAKGEYVEAGTGITGGV